MSKQDAVQYAQAATAAIEPATATHLNAGQPPGTAGALLREARQAQGIDIATLAALLKVPAHKLEALEQDRFDLLTDPVFARALASSICRILKLDAALVLQRLPAITAFSVTSQNRGINTPFRPRGGGRHAAPLWTHMSRPAVLVGLAFLLGALVLVFLPSIQQVIASYRQDDKPASAAPPAEQASVTTTVTTPVASGQESGAAAAAAPGAILAPTDAPVNLAASPAGVNADGPPLTFTAKAAATVKVTDARGLVVLERTLRAGDVASASGALPLSAVVSRADAVQVQVRGQALDLGSASQNNIARFEVK